MHVLYVEPFDGGSHASFTQALTTGIAAKFTVLRLPGRHWKWRMRGFAAWAALEHGAALAAGADVLFASSFVPLAELVGLVPALATIPRLLYFHENQLAYPTHGSPDPRDHHFGFTQLVSALAADACLFNSAYNRDSFLEHGRAILDRMPDAVPRGWIDTIAARSEVLPVPIALPDEPPPPDPEPPGSDARDRGPIVLWNHRWEHDKNPEAFFAALLRLRDEDVPFRVAVCGQSFRRTPAIFEHARAALSDRIEHWGFCPDVPSYHALMRRSHIAISTAHHEFFGVAMIEATHAGARPLVPDRLAYPELFAAEYRYRDDDDLVATLRRLCLAFVRGQPLRADRRAITQRFSIRDLLPIYEARLRRAIARGSITRARP